MRAAKKVDDLRARAKSLQTDLEARERRRLRERVRLVRVAHKRARARIRTWARGRRTAIREHYQKEKRAALERLRAERWHHLNLVRERANLLRRKASHRFAAIRAERLGELRRQIADQLLIVQRERARVRALRSIARERRQESDDEVRSNIDAEYRPIYERVKKHIRGGPRRTRTEAFLEWLSEHPDEVLGMQAAAAEQEVEQMVRERHRIDSARARTPSAEIRATWRGRSWLLAGHVDGRAELTMKAGRRQVRWRVNERDEDWSLGKLAAGKPTTEDARIARAWVDSLDGWEPLDDLADVPF